MFKELERYPFQTKNTCLLCPLTLLIMGKTPTLIYLHNFILLLTFKPINTNYFYYYYTLFLLTTTFP